MTDADALAAAWQRWIGVLRAHGCAIDAGLRPPVAPADLDEATSRTGHAPPPAATALLRLADGQMSITTAPRIATYVFPGHEFLPVSRAADERVAAHHEHDPSWWPIAHDGGGNLLWVTPDASVVLAGRDETARVVARDLVTLFAWLSAQPLGPPEPNAWEDGFYWWESPAL